MTLGLVEGALPGEILGIGPLENVRQFNDSCLCGFYIVWLRQPIFHNLTVAPLDMGEITPFAERDAPEVASLFVRVFRKTDTAAPASLQQYFVKLYIEHPWGDQGYSSLIHRNASGKLTGFIGALPRPMIFRERQITAVVAGNHMVDPLEKDPFTGFLLLRQLLSGGQDLTYSDSANDVSVRLWNSLGAKIIHLYSLRWVRILKPIAFGTSLLFRNGQTGFSRQALGPLSFAFDGVISRRILNKDLYAPIQECSDGDLEPSTLRTLIERWSCSRGLRPFYDDRGIRWILQMAEEKKQFGILHKHTVMQAGSPLGWYLVYARPGGVAEVLQMFARDSHFHTVFRQLCKRAAQLGSIAVTGQVEPTMLRDYSENKCLLFERNLSTLAYSREPEILDSMFRGDAFISRMEAEWWTRLQGDTFE